ncbi:MAG: PQQ-binding-like beta-propeller repeat protein, partial [Planctomycetota bacterium]|nr:PQQ-binding-like beta-propeller repeat protein [Planctomycetota bacterium]
MTHLHSPLISALVGCAILSSCAVTADDDDNWPRFRGSTAMGVAKDDPRLPERWSTTENVLWRQDIPGTGWSGPVVWGEKVFLTTVVSDRTYEKPRKGLYLGGGRPAPPGGVHHWLTYCLDTQSGEVLWKREAHTGEPKSPRHPKSTYASETPATDGERLYVLFGDVGLYCYDLSGKPIWSQDIEPRKTLYGYGAAASPVVHGDQVIMVYDTQETSYIASFDSRTGKERWRTERDEMSSWATPLVWRNPLRTEIVTPGKRRIRSYDLAGELLWELDGRMSGLVIPSPFASFGMVYIT